MATGDAPFGIRIALRLFWLIGEIGLGKPVARALLGRFGYSDQAAMARDFAGFAPGPQDLVVSTYSKSGTNWMLQIAYQIAHRGAGEFTHIHDVCPWPDGPAPLLGARLDDPFTGSHRIIKTHLERDFVPRSPSARYVVVIRDPKDVFVSSYHFIPGVIRGVMDVEFSVAEWLELFLRRDFALGSWAAHAASWWAEREAPDVLVFTFGELRADLPAAVDRVAAHMGVSLTEDERAAVIERSGFAWMKAHDERFAPPVPRLRAAGGASMIRSGKRGASGELIDADQRAAIDRWCREGLAELDSDLPYGELFEASERG